MIFKTKYLTKDFSMVYGFRNKKDVGFNLVTTLQKKGDTTIVHGLHTGGEMTPHEFIELWRHYKKTVTTSYLEFEVIPIHAKFYRIFLSIEESYKSKTFNGHDCEVLKVNMKSRLKSFSGGKRGRILGLISRK